MPKLKPNPSQSQRAEVSQRIRIEAAKLSHERLGAPIDQRNNNESQALTPPVTTFTKSMCHDDFGIVVNTDFSVMINEINQDGTDGGESPFLGSYSSMKPARFDIPLYQGNYNLGSDIAGPRAWESPLSGHIYELEGPDSDAVAMPPAPKLGSAELTAEMAEIYMMALCRDIPFEKIEDGSGSIELEIDGNKTPVMVTEMLEQLNLLQWNNRSDGAAGENFDSVLSARERARREAHFEFSTDNYCNSTKGDNLTLKTLFRGSTPGSQVGPYISQFFLIGTPDRDQSSTNDTARTTLLNFSSTALDVELNAQPRPGRTSPPGFVRMLRSLETNTTADAAPENRRSIAAGSRDTDVRNLAVRDGFIAYGQQLINQRILPQVNGKDYLSDWASWIDVQNGANLRNRDEFGFNNAIGEPKLAPFGRFIHSPRDLATFVHYDQLYQAYHNAMLILLGLGASTDHGLPENKDHPTRNAFATFGDPHILTLLPEVATRALKAVRRQKFQTHLRARPEALGGVLSLASHDTENSRLGNAFDPANLMLEELKTTSLPKWIKAHNSLINKDVDAAAKGWIGDDINLLLSQAFPEGSPVHGSYGAGHATVAGACTTVLKAFFEMYDVNFKPEDITLDEIIRIAPTDLFNTKQHDRATDLRDILPTGEKHYFVTTDLETPEKKCEITIKKPDGTEEKKTELEPAAIYPGSALKAWANPHNEVLTIEGELDKLAANVSIGRNFAGVHYYTDYYESLRMGERIAVGMLQEQMLTYREPISMRFTSFDGDKVMITGSGGSRGLDDAEIHVWERGTDRKITVNEWWNRCLRET